jgi:hypothetical protein
VLAPSEATNLVNRQRLKVLLVGLAIFYGLGLIVLSLKETIFSPYPYNLWSTVFDGPERQEVIRVLGAYGTTQYDELIHVDKSEQGENLLEAVS